MPREPSSGLAAIFLKLRQGAFRSSGCDELTRELFECPETRSLLDAAIRDCSIDRHTREDFGYDGLFQLAAACLMHVVRSRKIKTISELQRRGRGAVGAELMPALARDWRCETAAAANYFKRLLRRHGVTPSILDRELAELTGLSIKRIRELRQAYWLNRASSSGLWRVTSGDNGDAELAGDELPPFLRDECDPFDQGDYRYGED